MSPEPSDELFERIAERLKALADPKMRASGVLASRRDGTSIYYRVIDPAAFTICRTVCDALEQRAETEHRLLKSVALAARKASK